MMKPVLNEAEEGTKGERTAGSDKVARNQKGQMKRLEHVMETKFREIDNMLNKKILVALHDMDQRNMQKLHNIESTNQDMFETLKAEQLRIYNKTREEMDKQKAELNEQMVEHR